MIPYGRQEVTEEDIRAVVAVLRSDHLTQGPAIERFEASVSEYCGAGSAVAVANGTAALHLACRAAGLEAGGLLWTSPNTFVASANCARYCGADVDFVDIEPDTGNMDVQLLADKLEMADRRGRLPDIVIPVHFAGASCDMAAVGVLAERYGFRVIEDASHAVGAHYRDRPVGCCDHSDMAVFSFHPVKIVTSAEGGMVLTNNPETANQVELLRTHGITRDQRFMEGRSHGPWYYEQVDLGMNYRMTDLQAALGTSQMTRLAKYVGRRKDLATRYDQMLRDLPLVPLSRRPGVESSFHLYVVRLRSQSCLARAELVRVMRSAGIGVNVHYIPVHLQPYYRRLGFGPGDFPRAEEYYETAITLPLFPAMRDEEQEHVVRTLEAVLE